MRSGLTSYCGDIEKYKKYLKGEEKRSGYIDPDITYTDSNSEFYEKISCFLNKQEERLAKRMKSKKQWTYKVVSNYTEGNEIPVGIMVEEGAEKMYLRSDQFGFSALDGKYINGNKWHVLKNPYAKYWYDSKEKNKYDNIAKWIWSTRTIGGSFIWPIRKCGRNWQSMYNTLRGRWLQDRVDLTLLEVKRYYESNGKNTKDILYTSELSKKESKMKEWLAHFGTFENYIDFFMLTSFVVKVKSEVKCEYIPRNILTGDVLTEEDEIKGKDGKMQDLNAEDLCNMLNNVSDWTLNRSTYMEKIIGEMSISV